MSNGIVAAFPLKEHIHRPIYFFDDIFAGGVITKHQTLCPGQEITSNTATATLLMPILAIVGTSAGVDPAIFMIPAAMAASCAFMLPVATAPNAIAYGTGEIEIKDMVIEGALLSFLVSCIVAIVTYFLLH